jgi:hypothetical protein
MTLAYTLASAQWTERGSAADVQAIAVPPTKWLVRNFCNALIDTVVLYIWCFGRPWLWSASAGGQLRLYRRARRSLPVEVGMWSLCHVVVKSTLLESTDNSSVPSCSISFGWSLTERAYQIRRQLDITSHLTESRDDIPKIHQTR